MAAQILITALIVTGCMAHTLWTLMPAAARRAIANWALRVSLPAFLAKPFRKALRPASACGGCGQCGDTAAPKSALQTVKFHARRRG